MAAGAVLLSPFIPFLFMGEEYGEEAPFFFFISHSDKHLIKEIQQSKQEEFAAFVGQGEIQDPQSANTFQKCQLKWENREMGKHKVLWEFYQKLIQLRRTIPALKNLDKESLEVSCSEDNLLQLRRWSYESQILSIMNFNKKHISFTPTLLSNNWQKILDSSDIKWIGPGATLPEKVKHEEALTIPPQCFALYEVKL